MSMGKGALNMLPELPSVWETEATVEWVVDRMIPVGSVNLVSAESGTGKTWVAYALAGAVSQGQQFLGLPVKQMPVLYIDGENPLALVKDRLHHLAIPKTPDLYIWGGWAKDAPPRPSELVVKEFAQETGGLIIWDSLIEFHSGEESSATETRKYMKEYRALANAGATIILLHHTGKSSSAKKYRGSSDIKAAVDTAYLLSKSSAIGGSDKLRRLKMTNFKSRFAEGRDFALEFASGEGFRTDEQTKSESATDTAGLLGLLSEDPINGTEFKRRAMAKGYSREVSERFLREWPHRKPGSKPREKLYFLLKAA